MKALLLKEWYQIRGYFLYVLLLAVVWIVISLAGRADGGLSFVPLLFGMLPVSTVTLDETSRFQAYAFTMPQSRKTIVTAKYVFALLTAVFSLLLTGIPMCIILGTADAGFLRLWLTAEIAAGLALPVFTLPIHLYFGTAKAQIIRLTLMGAAVFGWIFFAGIPMTAFITVSELRPDVTVFEFGEILAVIALLLIGSWYISVRLYERRDF